IVPEIIEGGQPKLLKYDNTAKEEIVWGLGLGCNGVVEVFVELAGRMPEVDVSIQKEEAVALATVVRTGTEKNIRPGLKMSVSPDGQTAGSLGDNVLATRVARDAIDLLKKEKSRTAAYELEANQTVEVFIEAILPPPPLVIIGADPDSVPLVRFGKQLGFQVILVDHRPEFANAKKFPDAAQVIVALPEEMTKKVPINEKAFILIKTHNYLRDKEILKQVLKSKARYVGQLGPKARATDLLKDLANEGVEFPGPELEKLFAPVGLDIGAEDPEQIALSVLAELLAVKSGRRGGFLKEQTQPIHPRE
ncbi:MAG: XdhC family protein, partial [bacterium]